MILVFLLRRIAKFLARAAVVLEWRAVKRELAAFPELYRIHQKFKSSPEGQWIIGEDDAVNLYRLLLHAKPQRILELGTGIGAGTAVMAEALKRLGQGHIVSIEQSSHCVAVARDLLGPLGSRVSLIQAPPIIFKIEQVSRWTYFCGYDWLPQPEERFDFVCLDGPGAWLESGELMTFENGMLFRLLPFLADDCLVYVDGRLPTVKRIQRHLGAHFITRTAERGYTILQKKGPHVASFAEAKITDAKRDALGAYLKGNVVR
jgi:SAM-dependent methyltransferase